MAKLRIYHTWTNSIQILKQLQDEGYYICQRRFDYLKLLFNLPAKIALYLPDAETTPDEHIALAGYIAELVVKHRRTIAVIVQSPYFMLSLPIILNSGIDPKDVEVYIVEKDKTHKVGLTPKGCPRTLGDKLNKVERLLWEVHVIDE